MRPIRSDVTGHVEDTQKSITAMRADKMSAILTGGCVSMVRSHGGLEAMLGYMPRPIRPGDDPCDVRAAELRFRKAASFAWNAVRLFSDVARRAAARTQRVRSSAGNAVRNCPQLASKYRTQLLPPGRLRKLHRLNAASSR